MGRHLHRGPEEKVQVIDMSPPRLALREHQTHPGALVTV